MNKKGADQPSAPHSLISIFVIGLLEIIKFILVTSEMSLFHLVSVAEETGFGMTCSETRKTGILAPILYKSVQSSMKNKCTYAIIKVRGLHISLILDL